MLAGALALALALQDNFVLAQDQSLVDVLRRDPLQVFGLAVIILCVAVLLVRLVREFLLLRAE